MKKTIVRYLKMVVPKPVYTRLKNAIERRKNIAFLDKLKGDILKYYEHERENQEVKEVVNYLKTNPITVYPYDFTKKYNEELIEVFTDQEKQLRYVIHEEKRLYFKRSLSETAIKKLYLGLQLDQDKASPHLYLTEGFKLEPHDIIADIGAAEGNFSLSNIEKVKKVYLFEYDQGWLEALRATFEPWKDKVVIIDKFVSNVDSDTTISMNSFYSQHPKITFFKVDIEGSEARFLEGFDQILNKDISMKMALCTYHKQNDEKEFTQILDQYGFKVAASNRYMIFIYDKNIEAPYLRRGLLRATR